MSRHLLKFRDSLSFNFGYYSGQFDEYRDAAA